MRLENCQRLSIWRTDQSILHHQPRPNLLRRDNTVRMDLDQSQLQEGKNYPFKLWLFWITRTSQSPLFVSRKIAVCGQNIYRSYGHKHDNSIGYAWWMTLQLLHQLLTHHPSVGSGGWCAIPRTISVSRAKRKFRGIVDPGFYAGFLPKPGVGWTC